MKKSMQLPLGVEWFFFPLSEVAYRVCTDASGNVGSGAILDPTITCAASGWDDIAISVSKWYQ